MRSYDGAEICELVGLFILNSLQELFGKDVGLYRDDGLAVLNTKSGRLCKKARKYLILKFDELGLRITALTNQQSTNFLDITFTLQTTPTNYVENPTTNLFTLTTRQTTHRLFYVNYPIQLTNVLIPYLVTKKTFDVWV